MNRITKSAAAVAVAAGLAVGGVSATGASATYRLNGTDAKFLRSNEQVNLAEIALGKVILQKSRGPAARNLAMKTIADHRAARKANQAVAGIIGIGEPSMPNAMQRAVAAHLKGAARINRYYFTAQVAGHKTSVAQTKYEIANGIRPRVVNYAKEYLPVAQMHLPMAERDLARWTQQHR